MEWSLRRLFWRVGVLKLSRLFVAGERESRLRLNFSNYGRF